MNSQLTTIMKLPNNHTIAISQIIREVYNDLTDLGAVSDFIHPNVHTADFELPEGFKMRVCETKNGVFYNIFREK